MSNRMKQLQALALENPDDSFVLFAIAKEHESLGDLNLAEEKFLHLKSLDEDYIGLYYHLGQIQEALDKNEAAMATYLKGIEKAKILKDQHALSELQNVKMNLELGL